MGFLDKDEEEIIKIHDIIGNITIIAFILFILMFVCLFITTTNEWKSATDIVFIILLISFIIWILSMVIYIYIEDKNEILFINEKKYVYGVKDFGYFKTKIPEKYLESWDEHTPNINIDNCKIKVFEKKTEVYLKEKTFDYSLNQYVKEKRNEQTIIKITYLEFLTEEDHHLNENKINSLITVKTNQTEESTKHYCEKNIHIIFEAYTKGYSPFYKDYFYDYGHSVTSKEFNDRDLSHLRMIALKNVEL